MTVQTMHLELPAALFQRVSVQAPDDARELVTFSGGKLRSELGKDVSGGSRIRLELPRTIERIPPRGHE